MVREGKFSENLKLSMERKTFNPSLYNIFLLSRLEGVLYVDLQFFFKVCIYLFDKIIKLLLSIRGKCSIFF